MRTIITLILWLYFLPGALLGVALFAMQALQSAMGAPPPMELAADVGSALVQGLLRMAYWLPSVYENVVVNGVPPLQWALS